MITERKDFIRVELSPKNPFGLTVSAKENNRNLFIEEPKDFAQGTSMHAQDLVRTLLLAHSVVRHFPKKIETNFNVDHKVFLDSVYDHYGFFSPKIVKGREQIVPAFVKPSEGNKEQIQYANAHSGGLDSLYRLAKLLSEDKKVLVSHLKNLNPKGNYKEAVASRKQAETLGVAYEEIRLRNGSDNTGFTSMRTRDMLLALVVAIVAEPYGAKRVCVEGDMQTDPGAHFSEYKPAWKFFNKLISDVGLNSQVEGLDAHDIETVGEVLKLESELGVDLLPLVQNCFSAGYQLKNNRGKWERETPFIAQKSPSHWCGSCLKCRRITLGRIFYQDKRLEGVPQREVKYFVDSTYKWLEDYPNNDDLISQSFLECLANLSKR